MTTDCDDDFCCGIPVLYLAFVCKTCSIDDDSQPSRVARSLSSHLAIGEYESEFAQLESTIESAFFVN